MTNRALLVSCVLFAWLVVLPCSSGVAEDPKPDTRGLRWSKLPLSNERPPDLELDLAVPDDRRLFGEWIYGSQDSARVAVVVHSNSKQATRVYLDRDRDRCIAESDRVKATEEIFLTKLDAQHFDGEQLIDHSRDVALRYHEGDAHIRVATLSRPTHRVDTGGEVLPARQVDVDANGRFADPRDRIQIDLDGDGKFNPFLETFPLRASMNLLGRRWFVKADVFGERLQLEPATATGQVAVKAHGNSETDVITNLVLTLTGDDGSVFTLEDLDQAAELPVGDYYASALFVAIRSKGERTWEFTFSSHSRPSIEKRIQVRQGKETTVDPIGTLSFDAELGKRNSRTGQISVQPRLYTETGMLINQCHQAGDDVWSGPRCEVHILGANKTVFGHATSGFA